MFWVSKVEDLLNRCNENIRKYRYKLIWWSFWNNFEGIQEGISFDGFEKEDFEKFIEICDNRLDRSKTFLSDIAVVFGFDLVALTFVLDKAMERAKLTIPIGTEVINLLPYSGLIIATVLFVFLAILFAFLVHYRSHTHAWTAFKEKAILTKPEKGIGRKGQ